MTVKKQRTGIVWIPYHSLKDHCHVYLISSKLSNTDYYRKCDATWIQYFNNFKIVQFIGPNQITILRRYNSKHQNLGTNSQYRAVYYYIRVCRQNLPTNIFCKLNKLKIGEFIKIKHFDRGGENEGVGADLNDSNSIE